MVVIKKQSDVNKIKDSFHREIVENLWLDIHYDWEDYKWEDDGWFVYFEEGDDLFSDSIEGHLFKITRGIYHDMFKTNGNCWEAVVQEEDLYNVLVMLNNQFGMNYFIPDAEWVDPILLETLDKEREVHDQ